MAYVYKHIRLDKEEVFYIGVGSDIKNFTRANAKCQRNQIWTRIKNKTKYIVEIVKNDLSFKEALILEIELIKLYGRINNNTGTLANMTDGGEGCLGRVVTDKQKQWLSFVNKMKPSPNKGRVVSAETRLKLSKALTGLRQSDETRLKKSKSLSGRNLTADHVSKLRAAQIGKPKNFGEKKEIYDQTLRKRIKITNLITNEAAFVFGAKAANKLTGVNEASIREYSSQRRKKDNIKGFSFLYEEE